MGLISVLVAAAAGWVLGSGYYMTLSKPWLRASGIPIGPDGRPAGNGSPLPFVLSAIAMLVVAGMMRHIFAMAGIAGVGGGLVAGLGIGAFFIAPWIVINNAYGMRSPMLSLIDSGYAIGACGLIGLVLTLI